MNMEWSLTDALAHAVECTFADCSECGDARKLLALCRANESRKRIKKIIHVSQPVIRRNLKHGGSRPPITIRVGGKIRHASKVSINGPCKILYSPSKPLSCGARLWIETESGVK